MELLLTKCGINFVPIPSQAEHFLRPFKYSLRNTKQFKLSSSLPPWNNLKTTRRYIHATLFLESMP